MKPKLIKKITAKALGLAKKDLINLAKENADKKEILIFRALGRNIKDFEIGSSEYGEWYKFKGEFRATNAVTGEIYSSANLMLPDVASDLLKNMIDNAKSQAQQSAEAEGLTPDLIKDAVRNACVNEFAIDITIIPVLDPDTGNMDYSYGAQSLIEEIESDPFAELTAKIGATPLIESKPKSEQLVGSKETIERPKKTVTKK